MALSNFTLGVRVEFTETFNTIFVEQGSSVCIHINRRTEYILAKTFKESLWVNSKLNKRLEASQ